MGSDLKENEVIKKTVCNMCNVRCGLDVHVQDGRITKIESMPEHPLKPLCVKADGIIEWVYSPQRVTQPMKKIDGKWRAVSWDEALEFFSEKLFSIKEEYAAKSVVVFSGITFSGLHDLRALIRRWCDIYGTPNLTTGGSYCHRAHVIAHGLTLDYGSPELMPDFPNSRCIMNWGRNPKESMHIAGMRIDEAKKRRAKLIVIDPRRTETAKKADIHAQIRPDTDCALALGMLNVIITEQLYDKDFVDKWTVGFERLVDHIKEYTPEKVAEITWVPSDTIKEIARTYATTKPAAIFQYISVDHSINGVQTSRAIATLVSITGNLEVSGGNRICPAPKFAKLNVEGLTRPSEEDSISAKYPIYDRFVGYPSSTTVTDAIITGNPYPVKALIVQGGNPAITWPNSKKVNEALSNLDLLVVIDMFMTDTAERADLFLPISTFLERKILVDYHVAAQIPRILRTEPVIEPLGEAKEDWRIWSELGIKMFGNQYFPWEDADDIYEAYVKTSGITIDELKQKPVGIEYAKLEEKAYLSKGFNTPSGKVEIYSKLLEDYGYDPLPTYHEPSEGPITTPKLAREYPLIAMTGPRKAMFTHSQFRNIPALREKMPEPLIEINAETATELKIKDGDMVRVESVRGEIQIRAKTTGDIHPRVVSIPHGWSGESNANMLTDDMARDPISGYPPFRSVLCRVNKL
jgi:anaerobic selenocysteine-containing dehydrogenase